MPRDDWAKARAKDAAKRSKRPQPRKSRKRGSRKRGVRSTNGWNPNTVLWFGKHKGQPLCNIPQDYLVWLANSNSDRSWRISELQRYLRTWLATRDRVSQPTDGRGLAANDRETEPSRPEHAELMDDIPDTGRNQLDLAFEQLAKGTRC